MSDSDFEYDYESSSDWSNEKSDDNDVKIEIENTFYEADDIKKNEPQEALQKFLKVLELESELPVEERAWSFKTIRNVVVILGHLARYEEMCEYHQQLLEQMDNVARNDATDAINSIIDAANKIDDPNYSMRLFSMTVERLKLGKNERLWFNTEIKLAKLYLDNNDLQKAQNSINTLIRSCQFDDGTDDPQKAQNLLEAYSLEIQLCTITKNTKRMKEIYQRADKLTADISDPRIMGIIKESGSKMYMNEKQWDKALTEFFEAFKCYQEIGNPRAKIILKYVVLASILSDSKINPFHSQEATVFKDDPEILAMMRLRTAYEHNDINELQSILQDRSVNILKDTYIATFLEDLLRSVRLNILIAKIRPYRTVKLDYLGRELGISSDNIQSLLVELILEEKIYGRIDEIDGYIEVYSEKGGEGVSRRDKAIGKWIQSLSTTQNALADKIRFQVTTSSYSFQFKYSIMQSLANLLIKGRLSSMNYFCLHPQGLFANYIKLQAKFSLINWIILSLLIKFGSWPKLRSNLN